MMKILSSALACGALLAGCATAPPPASAPPAQPAAVAQAAPAPAPAAQSAPPEAPPPAPVPPPSVPPPPVPPAAADPVFVTLSTTLGDIVLELDAQKAPRTVANFQRYVKEGFYDGTVFHRVIPGFMAQAGGYTGGLQPKPTHEPVVNEAANGLRNLRASIAMARTAVPDSATSQFFINVADNAGLDYPAPDGHGYAVFGRVVAGMDVVDHIVGAPTAPHPRWGAQFPNLPQTPIFITAARLGR
jgi:peptidyl-prolyl cis-trans isomerase A (cyclophilin A)